MNKPIDPRHPFRWQPLAAALSAMFLASGVALAAEVNVSLSGNQEVPPVQTMASGSGSFTINPDKTVSGHITTKGITAVAAHIHDGAMGKNGPVAVPLSQGWRQRMDRAGRRQTERCAVRGLSEGRPVRQRAQCRASGR